MLEGFRGRFLRQQFVLLAEANSDKYCVAPEISAFTYFYSPTYELRYRLNVILPFHGAIALALFLLVGRASDLRMPRHAVFDEL